MCTGRKAAPQPSSINGQRGDARVPASLGDVFRLVVMVVRVALTRLTLRKLVYKTC